MKPSHYQPPAPAPKDSRTREELLAALADCQARVAGLREACFKAESRALEAEAALRNPRRPQNSGSGNSRGGVP